MATKETLIAIAIKNSTAIFTSNELLQVAEITSNDVKKIRDTAESNFDKAIKDFLINAKGG